LAEDGEEDDDETILPDTDTDADEELEDQTNFNDESEDDDAALTLAGSSLK